MHAIAGIVELAPSTTAMSAAAAGAAILLLRATLAERRSGAIRPRAVPTPSDPFAVGLAEGQPFAAPEPELKAEPGGFDHSLRVLIAEANPANRKVVEVILASFGLAVGVMDDIAAVAETATTAHFDVIVIGVGAPPDDGLAAIRALRAVEAAHGRPRAAIVALMEDDLADAGERVRLAGADQHLVKPVQVERLLAAMTNVRPARRCEAAA